MDNVVELEIPSDAAYVGVVRLALSSFARASGVDEETLEDLKMAASEACANAVLSNSESNPQAPVTVQYRQEPDRIVIEVGDRGESYAPQPADSSVGDERLEMSVALLR
ncbi:MAG: ATP-binding protein, partial [Actinomycetota bacterium]|nr:ATP-binding protein [Actinomycetota bacterium]